MARRKRIRVRDLSPERREQVQATMRQAAEQAIARLDAARVLLDAQKDCLARGVYGPRRKIRKTVT